MKYPNLFSEGKIGARIVKNRIVSAPVGENMAHTDGSFSDRSIAFYTERAKGGAGLIMVGAIPVDYAHGRSHANAHRMDQVKYIPGMKRLADNVHAYGALLVAQLQHAGARTRPSFLDGETPVCISDTDPETTSIRNCRAEGEQRVLTTEELDQLPERYVTCALHCQTAGCDGVEIHMAHGFLLNQLLSPDTNHREDRYGGSLENRLRLPVEIVRRVRDACGRRFIISARIPGAEFVRNGITQEETEQIAKALEEAGCNVLNISIGMTTKQTKIKEPEGSPQGTRLENASRIKRAVSIPVMTSGVMKEASFCDRVLNENRVDFVLIARQLICDPEWPVKNLSGRGNEIRPCLNCNAGCFSAIDKGLPLGCVLNPVTGEEYHNAEAVKALSQKSVMVIGGGLNGMQAAITAAKRGHRVALYEKSDTPGGQMNIACVPPRKEAVRRACDWFIAELERNGIEVYTGVEVTVQTVEETEPDAVILATGAVPSVPPVPGTEHGVQSWEILRGDIVVKEERVVVIGGGLVGCETALHLCQNRNKLTIIEMLPEAAMEMESGNREQLLVDLKQNEVEIYTNTRVLRIEPDAVICLDNAGKEIRFGADRVVFATGQMPYGTELLRELRTKGIRTEIAGDDLTPATFRSATMRGYLAASVL